MDTILDQIDSMRQCKSEENLNALHAYLTKIRKMISEMNETVKQNEKLLISNKLSGVVEYKSSLKEYEDIPENHYLQMPTLGSKLDKGKELSIKFGDFRAILKQLPQTSLPADISYLTKQ